MPWQLQDAKQRLSQLIRQAEQEGPQIVTRHGHEVAVVLSAETYRKLSGSGGDFKAFLIRGPDLSRLEIERSTEPAPTIKL